MSSVANAWFISAPSNPTKKDTVDKLRERMSASKAGTDLADIYPFQLPEFKVGTLDSLMVISDELVKSDQMVETFCVKLADTLKGLLGNEEQWKSSLIVGDKPLDTFLISFQWNTMKYRSDKTLKELADMIVQEVNGADTVIKNKLQQYAQTKGTLQTLQRKTNGNLSVRSLNDVVKKEHFVQDSEYLVTILVAVPKALSKDWIESYETLAQMVVPRSTQQITQDDEYILYSVTLFQRVVDEFTGKAREKKFIVRDFKWDPEQLSNEKKQLQEVITAEKEQASALLRLCKASFGESYSSYLHLKALRTFIESILRYGLPPDFQPILVRAKPKQERKTRDTLNKHYAYIDKGSGAADAEIDEAMQNLIGEKDYAPVVLFGINTIY
ncbi:hypothetical protein EDD86DRAFT_188870 [Gorgonomyces haynaldii]|nr:hypothetical protein EDD86DRAFT_188870 [Gorgonomyces haynaldii]